tara:strand:- start:13 stop:810 length:798 start_codon:yes stop_codon:yes gene_type:complete
MRLGLFDSGVGGLTVLKKVAELFPNISFVYLADTARIPYGLKNTNELIEIAEEISSWFRQQNIDAFLVACNTTNATALDVIKKNLDVPVFDLIESVSAAIEESRVGILATPSTVKTKAYSKMILTFNPNTFVIEKACPEFVPMIEKDHIKLDEIKNYAIDYLEPLLKHNIECLILGCSHYPLIKPLLSNLLPSTVKLIDPAEALCLRLKLFTKSQKNNSSDIKYLVNSEFYVTSNPISFAKRAKHWLNVFPEVNIVSLQKKAWVS